jgi:uracil-DNA glycosylase
VNVTTSDAQAIRIALQHAETATLLGVDFLPARIESATGCEASKDRLSAQARSDSSARTAALQELQERHDASCTHCTVATGHTRTVFGEGSPDAALMFIGEAPGEEEDRTGRPFVGRAGQKLNQMIVAMGMTREQVYIANVLKTRPPNNRTPLQPEVEACSRFLVEQIRIIQPRVIVSLGGPATKLLLRMETGITRLRGIWGHYLDDDAEGGRLTIPLMPTYHPAYLLRNYTQETRRQVWADMQAVLAQLGQLP